MRPSIRHYSIPRWPESTPPLGKRWRVRNSTTWPWPPRSGTCTRSSSRKSMRYVILRDDDTNALTPVDCLERLYRPFLDRGFPVNLAVIPEVRTDAVGPDGRREGFLGDAS